MEKYSVNVIDWQLLVGISVVAQLFWQNRAWKKDKISNA